MQVQSIGKTNEQIEKLKHLAAAGASPARIAAALNRPVAGVRARARLLGIDLPTLREIRAKLRESDPHADR